MFLFYYLNSITLQLINTLMKTQKELFSTYFNICGNIHKLENHQSGVIETLPNVTDKQREYVRFIDDNIYSGNTVKDFVNREFNVSLKQGTAQELESAGLDFDEVKQWIENIGSNLAQQAIDKQWQKHQKELSNWFD